MIPYTLKHLLILVRNLQHVVNSSCAYWFVGKGKWPLCHTQIVLLLIPSRTPSTREDIMQNSTRLLDEQVSIFYNKYFSMELPTVLS